MVVSLRIWAYAGVDPIRNSLLGRWVLMVETFVHKGFTLGVPWLFKLYEMVNCSEEYYLRNNLGVKKESRIKKWKHWHLLTNYLKHKI